MNFYSKTLKELEILLTQNEFKAVHAKSLFQDLYKNKLTLDELAHKEYPKNLLNFLKSNLDFSLPKIATIQTSEDSTKKFLFTLSDQKQVEAVLIPFHHKFTICLSTQVGCAMNCSFCYTGKQGFTRNLMAHEIIGIYLETYKYFEKETQKTQIKPNIVYMGQGEPLHNFDEVKKATDIFLETFGIELGPRNITLSTAGYLPGIIRLNEMAPINIALSLHSALSERRNELIPINKQYPLNEVLKRLLEKPRLKKQYIVCEYLLIKDFNDDNQSLEELVKIVKHHPIIINLIPFNPFPGSLYERPSLESIENFKKKLEENKIVVMIRTTKGEEILAACGQLYVEEQNRKRKKESNTKHLLSSNL